MHVEILICNLFKRISFPSSLMHHQIRPLFMFMALSPLALIVPYLQNSLRIQTSLILFPITGNSHHHIQSKDFHGFLWNFKAAPGKMKSKQRKKTHFEILPQYRKSDILLLLSLLNCYNFVYFTQLF